MERQMAGVSSALLCMIVMTTLAHAGDENIIVLQQQGINNTITVDQTNATGSQVGGVNFIQHNDLVQSEFVLLDLDDPTQHAQALQAPVLQLGSNNQATITVDGNDDIAYLQQNNQGQSAGNTADIYVNSGLNAPSFAAITQLGGGNSASLSVNGSLSNGSVLQNGSNNTGTVAVNGDQITATLAQNGNDNNSTVQANGTNVTYTLNGSGVTTTTPVTVTSNGASVSITQTQF